MSQENSVKNAPSLIQALLILSACAMTGLSIYLTNHYFQAHFATDLGSSSSLCNISSFFTCSSATLSGASNIFGVPISLFGILIGLFIFAPYLFNEKRIEGTNFILLLANGIGCFVLFLYSLFILNTLCPMCSLYYVFSWIALGCYFKYSSIRSIDPLTVGTYGLITALTFGGTYASVSDKFTQKSQMASEMVEQYDQLPNLGNPSVSSPYLMAQASENFDEAPIQIAVFSDYQCPACKMKADVLHQIIDRYPGKINAKYYFYPLDNSCNPFMQRPMNSLSCLGAYLSVCLPPEDFMQVHDDIFDNQETLSSRWIREYAERKGVLECLDDPQTKEKVVELINASEPFRITSTPTMLLNGVKIEGVFPITALEPIFEELIRRAR